ncbi:MAG TPA: hypothetical protein VGM30_07270 [Puia sp.]
MILLQNLRTKNIGRHQIGGKLDPAERQIQCLRQGSYHQGLRQTRHPFQQAMPARHQSHQHLLDDGILPHDNLPDLFF